MVAVETLEYYVAKIEQAAEVQYSSDSENLTDPQELEEAVLVGRILPLLFFFLLHCSLETSPLLPADMPDLLPITAARS